jgi:sulfatase maturation enzyme AslB (radical SAM superfamily)
MILSINPWYYCNFRCKFCYLTEQQLSDKKLLELDRLNEILSEISQQENIDKVDLYGGELGLLPKQYWNDLVTLLNVYGIDDISLITNLSMVNDITLDDRVYTTVSYDFKAREDFERVFKNMALLNRPFSILVLASSDVMEQDVDEMITMFNMLENLVSVEIKPYSSNQANQFTVPYTLYEDFVKKWILHPNKNFEFVNESLLGSVLNKTRSSFSDDHVYITPNGKYGVLEFDLNDNEFFLEYDTLEEYWQWCDKEKHRVGLNKYCSSCEYYGNCLSEHLREVKSLEESCNGFKHLIDWYKNENFGMEN